MSKTASNSVFDIDGKPSFKAAFPLSLQHVLAMVVGNITPAIIVANVCKLSQADKTLLVQCAFFYSRYSNIASALSCMEIRSQITGNNGC